MSGFVQMPPPVQDRPAGNNQGRPGPSWQRGGTTTAKGDRCTQCIVGRKGCDGTKPVCVNCRRRPERCRYPEGRPSRTQVLRMLEEERQQNNRQQEIAEAGDDHGAVILQNDLTRGIDAGALLVVNTQQEQDVFVQGQRRLTQGQREWESQYQVLLPNFRQAQGGFVSLVQPFQQAPAHQPVSRPTWTQGAAVPVPQPPRRTRFTETERLEQVRERVLQSTRAYLRREREARLRQESAQQARDIVMED
ncbi:hypothetical protein A1O3_02970 [Capronia epimyces CBS 606.96]|uniref:Zn(2)-C6 fungal-type domain-containing protein n=1 Tax=Capronia epimyces CBS 606.96 TaxID=1182542 RepID=W9YBP0_9EURO|nr:uncharacterized protein A1O3_02970 [Capronia epimyces CBS 606.96]EXJ89903.1 hypothetical protein A1O3_02970 [Capronia epimyces CBS 606.96]